MFDHNVSFLKKISKYGGDWVISEICLFVHLISDFKYGVWARKIWWGRKDL